MSYNEIPAETTIFLDNFLVNVTKFLSVTSDFFPITVHMIILGINGDIKSSTVFFSVSITQVLLSNFLSDTAKMVYLMSQVLSFI